MYKLDRLDSTKHFRYITDFKYTDTCKIKDDPKLLCIYIMDILDNKETNFQCMIPIDYLRLYKGAVYKILGVSGDSNGTYFQLEYDAGYIYISFAVAYKTGTESVYRLTGRIFGIFN